MSGHLNPDLLLSVEEQTMDILIGSLVAGVLIGMILALVALGAGGAGTDHHLRGDGYCQFCPW